MDLIFRKILCPVNYDQLLTAVLVWARDLVEQNNALLWVLHVLPTESDGWDEGCKVQIENIARRRLEGRVSYRFLVRRGSPAREILSVAQEFEADLIVIPTHGRTGLKRLVLGSVAERIIRESRFPVLTIRLP